MGKSFQGMYLGVSVSNDKNTVISKTKIVSSNFKIVLNIAFNFTYKKIISLFKNLRLTYSNINSCKSPKIFFVKMKPENIKAYIVIRFKLGIKANDILSELKKAVPDHAPSLKTIYRWIVNSKKKSVRVEDKPRPGRPITKCMKSAGYHSF